MQLFILCKRGVYALEGIEYRLKIILFVQKNGKIVLESSRRNIVSTGG